MPSSAPDPKSSLAPKPEAAPDSSSGQHPAEQPVLEAHTLLKSLRLKIDQHHELEEAIDKLETALRVLAVKTGGML